MYLVVLEVGELMACWCSTKSQCPPFWSSHSATLGSKQSRKAQSPPLLLLPSLSLCWIFVEEEHLSLFSNLKHPAQHDSFGNTFLKCEDDLQMLSAVQALPLPALCSLSLSCFEQRKWRGWWCLMGPLSSIKDRESLAFSSNCGNSWKMVHNFFLAKCWLKKNTPLTKQHLQDD